jgi:UDP-N-acetylmuramate dehydrogenase
LRKKASCLLSADDAVTPTAGVPLDSLTTLGVGGRAQWLVRVSTPAQVRAAHVWAHERQLPVFVLGGGSNVVVADQGVRGLVLNISIGNTHVDARADHARVDAGAGEPWDSLVARVVESGYAGLECLSGIPGLVGGTPIQNVGAYGQEVADSIETVEAFDTQTLDVVKIPASECGFSYRHSRFKSADVGRFVVCRVTFRVARGEPTITYPDVQASVERSGADPPTVADVRRAVLQIRARKGMVLDPGDRDTRSVGSFFMNPIVPRATQGEIGSPSFPMSDGRVKIPAAWLIEHAGFSKGFHDGRVGLSSKHPLAIINRGGATASEIVEFAGRIKRAVFDRFGIALRPEPIFVGFADDERVHFLQRDSL